MKLKIYPSSQAENTQMLHTSRLPFQILFLFLFRFINSFLAPTTIPSPYPSPPWHPFYSRAIQMPQFLTRTTRDISVSMLAFVAVRLSETGRWINQIKLSKNKFE